MTGPDQQLNPSGPVHAGGAAEVVSVDTPFTEDGLYAMRAAVAAHTAAAGAHPEQVEQVVIVAGELASNAIRHGGGTGRLRIWVDQIGLHLQVSDHGPGMADPTVGSTPPDPASRGSRGMWICRQLVPDLRVVTGPEGTTVTATINLDQEQTATGPEPGPR